MKYFISLILLLSFAFQVKAKAGSDSLENKNLKVLPLPLFWYTPETKFGGGVAALFNFRFNKNDTAYRVSSVQIGEAYTQEKQWINFSSFQLFPNKEKLYIYGEAGYYKYRYYFFDIGNDNSIGLKEKYDINFSRIRTNFLIRTIPGFYVGPRYYFEKHKLLNLDSLGFLSRNNYLGVPDGRSSSLGFVSLYDTRDNIFFPTKGWFAEFSIQFDSKRLGSNYNFTKWGFDITKYFPLNKENVLALNILYLGTNGDAPFTQLAMFGGNKKMRGYYEGRFRDKHAFVFQAEYRYKVFKRWGVNLFFGLGEVTNKISLFSIQNIRFAGGIGLRFMIDTKQKINLRLDAARGIDKNKYYFTFNEAF